MSEHTPTPDVVLHHPERIPGYTYGTDEAARSTLTPEELTRLKEAVWLTSDDDQALRAAAWILADRTDDMTAWRARLAEQPWLAGYSGHPDGSRNPQYSAATKPRFDRWIIDGADSLDQIPMRYLLAFTAVIITTARDYLAAGGATSDEVSLMHAAFTKSVMLHVTLWTQPFVDAAVW